jgi:hypothetical protein
MLTRTWDAGRVDRRVSRRSPVSWPIRLWLGEDLFAPAHAADISRGGIRILTSSAIATALLCVGHSYRIELRAGYADDIVCLAELRYRDERSAGFSITGTLYSVSPVRPHP